MKINFSIDSKELEKLTEQVNLKIKEHFQPIEFGVLNDKRYNPRSVIKNYGGNFTRGVIRGKRKAGMTISKSTNSEVADALEEKYKIFSKPFQNKEWSGKVLAFFKEAYKKGYKNASFNGLRSIISAPIVKGEYGINRKKIGKEIVVFKNGLDTGQFHKSIAVRYKDFIYPQR